MDLDPALGAYLNERQRFAEEALALALTRCTAGAPAPLSAAMGYSLLSGGKRLRPILCLASAEALGGHTDGAALDFACALEFVHTYSLIHDDLPCMDDDDLRRGRPTSHKVHGEALAILAGDALLTEAFFLAGRGSEPSRGRLCAMLATAAGARGMVGGQVDDIREGEARTLETLASLHGRKTGALLSVACAGGAVAAGASEEEIAALERYGRHLGLAFQIRDDLLDVEGDPGLTGKSGGTDERKGKITYPSLLGMDAARALARREADAAKKEVALLASPGMLAGLADYAVSRDR